ncbi:MAG: cyclodeaminase/cyclohydrolase family protein [Clostridiales bacterium]|nr:cyclodeaminase/cyclohydrolase family protein [Clostridiales bacterium]
MKLIDMTLKDYTQLLASQAPAPGGGSTAALLGAQGAGLTAMVCALTQGRKKYLEHEPLCAQVREQMLKLTESFLEVLDRDTEAYQAVSAVFALPKDNDEQKTLRKAAMQTALKACTLPPFEMMELAAQTIELTGSILGKSNVNAASDLGVAMLCLKGALQGAWLNVLINLGGIDDPAFAEDLRSRGQKLLNKSLALADDVYTQVQNSL